MREEKRKTNTKATQHNICYPNENYCEDKFYYKKSETFVSNLYISHTKLASRQTRATGLN